MLKRLGILAGNLFLGGCASVSHSDRPEYAGPVVKPVWHISDVRVADTPAIHDRVVFAAARPWSEDKKYLYAFDLQTGKQLWKTEFAIARIGYFAGPVMSVADADGATHILAAQTGKEIPTQSPADIVNAIYTDKVLYAIGKDGTLRALDGPTHIQWIAKTPINVPYTPVVSGTNVYAYGRLQAEHGVEQGCAIYAFDRASGAMRWTWETKDTPLSDLAADPNAAYISLQGQEHGVVLAFDAATGQPHWTHPTARYFSEGPVLLDRDTVVVRDDPPGQHHVFQGLKSTTGEKSWQTQTSWRYDRWLTHDGLMYVADSKPHALLNEGGATSPDSWLTVVDLPTGKELWRSEVAPLATFTLPAVGNGMVVIGSEPFDSGKPEVSGLWAWAARK